MSRAWEAGKKKREAQERKLRRQTPGHRKRKAMTWLFAGAAAAVGIVAVAQNVDFSRQCPGHWHATFAVYVPDAEGQPKRIDFAAPRSQTGQAYYQLNENEKMDVSIHMHQSGAEQGSEALGPAQLHYETNGRCVGFERAMESVDVDLEETALTLSGAHEQAGQAGSWTDSGNQTLRVWVDTLQEGWQEWNVTDVLDYQPLDGESILVAFGNYTDDQMRAMWSAIPSPMTRAEE